MPFKFTIVDDRSLRPVDAVIGFEDSQGNPVRTSIPVSTAGITLQDDISEMSAIVVRSEGYQDYREPMNFLPGDYEIRMRKKTPWLLYLGVGAAALWVVQDLFKQKRKTT